MDKNVLIAIAVIVALLALWLLLSLVYPSVESPDVEEVDQPIEMKIEDQEVSNLEGGGESANVSAVVEIINNSVGAEVTIVE